LKKTVEDNIMVAGIASDICCRSQIRPAAMRLFWCIDIEKGKGWENGKE